MSPVPRPFPDFPVGATVRVLPIRSNAQPGKLAVVGLTGIVVQSSPGGVRVAFPGRKHRVLFTPHQLEPVPAG